MKRLLEVALSILLLTINNNYADTSKSTMTVSATIVSGCNISSPSITMMLGATAQLSCSTGSQPKVYNMPVQLIRNTVNSSIEADQLVIVTVIEF